MTPVDVQTFTLTVWRFTMKGENPREVSAIFPMDEARAREIATRRYGNMDGWDAFKGGVKVESKPALEDGETGKRVYRVTLTRSQSQVVEVEAMTEKEARTKADDFAEPDEWETDDCDVESCTDIGSADEKETP